MITTEAYISKDKMVGKDVFLLSVDLDRYKPWIPGMFMQLSLEPRSPSSAWLDSKAFSFASYGNSKARILVKREGNFTSRLIEHSTEGFRTSVRYPFGDVFLNSGNDKVMIAGGTGVSIFLSYIDFLNSTGSTTTNFLFHSVKNSDNDVRNFYWNSLPDKFHYAKYVTSQAEEDYSGRFTFEKLHTIIGKMELYEYYVCGPPSFNTYWVQELSHVNLKVQSEQWITPVMNQ